MGGMLAALQQSEPVVRIGLDQNAPTVTIRSTEEFTVQKQPTRTARFSPVLSISDSGSASVLRREDLSYRMAVELDGGRLLVLPMTTRIRIQPPPNSPRPARLQVGDRTYRGLVEVFGNSRNTFTVVNELPIEEYLLGVVPNELSPMTFGEIEALKAQAVAARTYVIRNLGQYRQEGYDICATDMCQVYFGAGTEEALSTRAVTETRGVIATYNDRPIVALYSSTCGGRTEDAANIFEEQLPYLVSVACEYKHPEGQPFTTTSSIADYQEAVLAVAGVRNYTDLRRFLGITGAGEPPSTDPEQLARYIREHFYPNAKPASDLEFLVEQGILTSGPPGRETLFRLIDRKGAFEWQQGVLVGWNGQTMKLSIAGRPVEFRLNPDAPIFLRVGEERTAMKEGRWIGGELFDVRAVDGVIQMAIYRRNFVSPSADRYSRLATWQTHKTGQEIDTAFRSLNLGEIQGIRVLARGPSERPVRTEVTGTRGKAELRALQLRSLLGLRDSLFFFDEERNAQGDLLGMTFYGSGWGHGVGMCQVGAYGMALDGATYEEILKKYYTGIELTTSF
jgi:stage II sporulation protein D